MVVLPVSVPVNLVEGAKHILYSDGSTMFDVLADAGNVKANGTLTVSGNTSLDGGNDRVGINNASPSKTLDVTGTLKVSGDTDIDGGNFVFNQAGASVDFTAETNTLTHAFFIDGSADKIGFGTNSPADALVEINQASSTGAIACLSLDQDDEDQEFIKFDGTSASDSSASISSSTDEGGSKVGAIRINVNGTDRFIRIYDTAI